MLGRYVRQLSEDSLGLLVDCLRPGRVPLLPLVSLAAATAAVSAAAALASHRATLVGLGLPDTMPAVLRCACVGGSLERSSLELVHGLLVCTGVLAVDAAVRGRRAAPGCGLPSNRSQADVSR
jgi:hypothetical protein